MPPKKKSKSGKKTGGNEGPYDEDKEIEELNERISAETVERGSQAIQ